MRQAVRAIIVHDNKLLVMHRNKFGTEYDTLPGGNIEIGESPEEALVREVREETSIDFSNPRLVYIEEAGVPYGTQYIYLCEYKSGEPTLDPGSEEAAVHKLGRNLYEPRWVSLDQLERLPFLSERLKSAIMVANKTSFPDTPIHM